MTAKPGLDARPASPEPRDGGQAPVTLHFEFLRNGVWD